MNKDKDTMRDTGGVYRHHDPKKPPRRDRRRPKVDPRDPDFKDTRGDRDVHGDPDLRSGSARIDVARRLLRIARELVAFDPYDRRFSEMLRWGLSRLGGGLGGHSPDEIVADVEKSPLENGTDLDRICAGLAGKYQDAWPAIKGVLEDTWKRYQSSFGDSW
jgi:hypothetical protein